MHALINGPEAARAELLEDSILARGFVLRRHRRCYGLHGCRRVDGSVFGVGLGRGGRACEHAGLQSRGRASGEREEGEKESLDSNVSDPYPLLDYQSNLKRDEGGRDKEQAHEGPIVSTYEDEKTQHQ